VNDELESEFRLRAGAPLEVAAVDAALRELDATCRASASARHEDTYLDDGRRSLLRAGIGLRLRESRGRCVITCKLRRELEGTLHVRREIEAAWSTGELPREASELPETLRNALGAQISGLALLPLLRLEVQRETRILIGDGRDVCELAIDAVTASANGRTATFHELELEVLGDAATSERLAHQLRARLPVEFACDDKPTHAAALLGLELAPQDDQPEEREG